MRLIDADALKAEFKKMENYHSLKLPDEEIIDNAPTVAFPFEICGNTCQIVRPQGEWITRSKGSKINRGRACSICGYVVEFSTNFCAWCGADMRGDKK